MKLRVVKEIDQEVIHYADSEKVISSKFNHLTIREADWKKEIRLPVSMLTRFLGMFRLIRRFLRLEKMWVIPLASGYVVFWQRRVYHLSRDCSQLTCTMKLTGFRSLLYNTVASIDGNELFFGEYGRPHPEGKSIYRSINGGLSWEKVFNFPKDKIRHIHSCNWDPYEEKIWVCTGDREGQSYILCADKEFKEVEWIGDGTQSYRAINLFFEEETVHWLMDSPLKEAYHIKLDRKTRNIEIKQSLPGPVWYSKKLADGYYVAATAQEKGPSQIDDKLHFIVSKDLVKWEETATFAYDGLPKGWFHFGLIAFAPGTQSSQGFYMFCVGVKGFDGKAYLCKLEN